jgi:hypothetical protein
MCEVSVLLPTSTNKFLIKDFEIFVVKTLLHGSLSEHSKHGSKFIFLVCFCDFCKEILLQFLEKFGLQTRLIFLSLFTLTCRVIKYGPQWTGQCAVLATRIAGPIFLFVQTAKCYWDVHQENFLPFSHSMVFQPKKLYCAE